MKEGSFVSTEWICSTDSNQYFPDLFTMYDSGSSILYILETQTKKEYLHISLDSRILCEDGSIVETGSLVSSYDVPFEVFTKETYPARIEFSPSSLRVWVPKQQIVLRASYSQQQTLSYPRQPQLSLPDSQLRCPGKPREQQQKLQNKNTFVSKQKGKISSNPSFHAQQKQQVLKKREVLLQPSSEVYHTEQL